MTELVWMAELDTGIREIDVQHKRILSYINALNELKTTSNRKELAAILDETVDYTISHFAFEEALMENAGYMFSEPHKRVHQLFARRVSEYKSRFEAGEDVTTDLHSMLSRWLFNHIRNEDHGYVEAVKTYMKMRAGQQEYLRRKMQAEQEEENQKRSWLSRLFGR